MNYEVRKLKREINSIMNEVYSVNESISSTDRQELIRGFEDRINELFGKSIGKFFGKTRNFFSRAADKAGEWKDKSAKAISNMAASAKQSMDNARKKAVEYYEKGKKLAGDAWESLKNFANQCVSRVKSAYASAMDSINAGWKSFKNSLETAYNEVSAALAQAWSDMKEKAEAFGEACKAIWAEIVEQTTIFIQSVKNKFKEMGDRSSKWIEENKAELEKNAESAAQSTLDGLKKLGQGALEVLKKTGEIAKNTGLIIVFMVIYPFELLWKGMKAIPGLVEKMVNNVNEFIAKEVAEGKAEYEKVRGEYLAGKEGMKGESFRYIKTFENFRY